jgi:hypothetical protein
MSDDEHERRQAITNSDVFEDAADDIRHLAHRKPGMGPEGRRFFLPVQPEAGS